MKDYNGLRKIKTYFFLQWIKIGVNFGNFPGGRAISALLFHGSLAGLLL